jgi:hypothetical protein
MRTFALLSFAALAAAATMGQSHSTDEGVSVGAMQYATFDDLPGGTAIIDPEPIPDGYKGLRFHDIGSFLRFQRLM